MSTINTLKKVAAIIISTEKETKKCIQGSGTLIQYSNKYYVITAEHCINGKTDSRLKDICPSDISIKVNEISLKVVSIIKADKIKDFAVLEVEKVNYNLPQIIYSIDIEEDIYKIYGYPKILDGIGRTYDCKKVNENEDTFILSCNDFHLDSSAKDAIKNVYGLSGSGVLITEKKSNRLILTGIVKETWDEDALYGDLICNDISFLVDVIPLLKLSSFSISNEIITAKKRFKGRINKEEIDNWKLGNNSGFKRIEDKCSFIYSENKLDKIIFNYIEQYLLGDILLDKIYIDAPEYEQRIRGYIYQFGLEVENDYSKEISSKDEGREIIRTLKRHLEKSFEKFDFIATENIMTLKNYTIAEYLRECSLNFED